MSFALSNLLGTVYRQGNVIFTPDGQSVVSPVGNRVSIFDLVSNKSRTLSFQNRKNIARIALSPDGHLLLSIDQDGRALLVNVQRSTVLHHFNFKKPVHDVRFSPNGKYILVTHGRLAQVWLTPSHLIRSFAPFHLHTTYAGHSDDLVSVSWSSCSRYFLTTGKDMTARMYTVNPVEGYRPRTFAGHRDVVLGAWFAGQGEDSRIVTVSRDGACFVWRGKAGEHIDEDEAEEHFAGVETNGHDAPSSDEHAITRIRWGISTRHYFKQSASKRVTSCTFHAPLNILVVGFSTGVFGLYEVGHGNTESDDFNPIHTLSISQEKISSVAIDPTGQWLAFGASKLGQLLVWEWQSESYILKQQGHYYDMNSLAFSTDGQTIITGGDDAKVKIWNATSGFCFVTFSDHSASVSVVEMAKQGTIVFSASLDGTVRAYDLVRYRNFRTFTSPSPVQFKALCVDPSGEVVVAGGNGEGFEIYMWSVQTGKLIEVLSGHEGPVSSLAFSPNGNQVASSSWDGSARLWDVFGRSSMVEPLQLSSDGLAVTYRPDGNEIAVSTLDGQITFFDTKSGRQSGLIQGRHDIVGGRGFDDRVTSSNSGSGKNFYTLTYTVDGRCLLAGGSSKYICMYDCREGILLRRFEMSENLSLDGTQTFLDSRLLGEGGVAQDMIDKSGDFSDLDERLDANQVMPGSQGGDMSRGRRQHERRHVRCHSIKFSPTGRSWACASTEGLMMYSLDHGLIDFDPFDLDLDVTPLTISTLLDQHEFLKALVMSFRLNERGWIEKVYQRLPIQHEDARLLVRQLPLTYTDTFLRFVTEQVMTTPHVEFHVQYIKLILTEHGRYLKTKSMQVAPTLRLVQKALVEIQNQTIKLCDQNMFSLRVLIDMSKQAELTSHKLNGLQSIMVD